MGRRVGQSARLGAERQASTAHRQTSTSSCDPAATTGDRGATALGRRAPGATAAPATSVDHDRSVRGRAGATLGRAVAFHSRRSRRRGHMAAAAPRWLGDAQASSRPGLSKRESSWAFRSCAPPHEGRCAGARRWSRTTPPTARAASGRCRRRSGSAGPPAGRRARSRRRSPVPRHAPRPRRTVTASCPSRCRPCAGPPDTDRCRAVAQAMGGLHGTRET